MSDINKRQVGGTHYRSTYQHWDFTELNGLGYLEGCATKYLTRSRKKHASPKEDLEKACHYLEKLIELHNLGVRDAPQFKNRISVEDFAKANGLSREEEDIIRIIAWWRRSSQLERAVNLIKIMIGRLPR